YDCASRGSPGRGSREPRATRHAAREDRQSLAEARREAETAIDRCRSVAHGLRPQRNHGTTLHRGTGQTSETDMKNRTIFALSLLLVGASLPGRAFAADLVLYDALDFAGPVAKAFEAKTGLKVDVVEPGSTGETLGKISAEGANPQFDIV